MRRAFNDLAGFVTGWVLFLDFLIVMALSALFVPHYLARRFRRTVAARVAVGRAHRLSASSSSSPACGSSAGRDSTSERSSSRCSTSSCRALLVLLGLALLLLARRRSSTASTLESGQDWSDLAFALPLAMLAYTGLETVANLAEEATEPGRTLPRSLFSAIGLVVVVTVLIGAIGLSAYPVTERRDGARTTSGSSCRSSESPPRSTARCRL